MLDQLLSGNCSLNIYESSTWVDSWYHHSQSSLGDASVLAVELTNTSKWRSDTTYARYYSHSELKIFNCHISTYEETAGSCLFIYLFCSIHVTDHNSMQSMNCNLIYFLVWHKCLHMLSCLTQRRSVQYYQVVLTCKPKYCRQRSWSKELLCVKADQNWDVLTILV